MQVKCFKLDFTPTFIKLSTLLHIFTTQPHLHQQIHTSPLNTHKNQFPNSTNTTTPNHLISQSLVSRFHSILFIFIIFFSFFILFLSLRVHIVLVILFSPFKGKIRLRIYIIRLVFLFQREKLI